MAKYEIIIVVTADTEDDAEYMARDMMGAAHDCVDSWTVAPKYKRNRRKGTAARGAK